MGKRLCKKLVNHKGETIAETLVALLISALALIMLAGSISTAKTIISSSQKRYTEYYTNDSKMIEEASAASTSATTLATVTVTVKESKDDTTAKLSLSPYSVAYYGNDTLKTYPTVIYEYVGS